MTLTFPTIWRAGLLAVAAFAFAPTAHAEFFSDVKRTFQTDVPHFFQDDTPCAFGGQPTSHTKSSCKRSGPPPARDAAGTPLRDDPAPAPRAAPAPVSSTPRPVQY